MKTMKKGIASMEGKARVPMWIVLLVTLVIAAFSLGSLGGQLQEGIEEQAQTAILRSCDQNIQVVESELMGRERTLKALAARVAGEDKKGAELLESLKVYNKFFGFWSIGLYDTNGIGYNTRGEFRNIRNEGFFLSAMDKQYKWTESEPNKYGSLNINIYSLPIVSDGEVVAVMTATYRSEDFQKLLSSGFLDGQGQSLILNREGRVVSTPKESNELYKICSYINENHDIAPEKVCEKFQTFEYDGTKYLAYVAPMKHYDWYVMGYVPYDFIFDGVRELHYKMGLIMLVMSLCIVSLVLTCLWTYKKMSHQILSVAFEDELTHVHNYEYLKWYFRSLEEKQKRGKFLVVFDIDKFKFVNILYGSKKGDELLGYIVKIFREVLPADLIFKGGADLFIAVMEGETDEEIKNKILLLTERFQKEMEEGKAISFALSFGICRMDASQELRFVYDNALLAKQEAKKSFTKKYRFFDQMEKNRIRQREVELAFDDAMKTEQFQVYYQPKFDMRTGRVCGAEALVRWQRPDGSMLSPGEFIPILEENGRIVELDEKMIHLVCRDMKEMQEKGVKVFPVSINLSLVHLKRVGIVEKAEEIVLSYGLDKQNFTFEITETAAHQDREVLNRMVRALQNRGFGVDMDDFGTGNSTLQSLSSADFSTMKLDKSFIDRIGTEKMDIIVRSTIQMVQDLSMNLVAEGVEKEEQVDFLLKNNCYVAQGYLFSRPLQKERYIALLEKEQQEQKKR